MRRSRGTLVIVTLAAAGLLTVGAAGAATSTNAVVTATTAASEIVTAPVAVARPVAPAAPIAPAAPAAPAKPVTPAKPAKPAVPVKPAKPAAPALVKGTPCSVTARACIDLSARRAWLIRNGVVQYGPVPITSGRAGYRTPTGTFRVTFKDIDHKSSVFDDAPMPNSVFFNGGIAFHQGSLSVLSHGCIHLSRAASATFFRTLSPGDVVQVRP